MAISGNETLTQQSLSYAGKNNITLVKITGNTAASTEYAYRGGGAVYTWEKTGFSNKGGNISGNTPDNIYAEQ